MSKGITRAEGLIRKVFAIPHDDENLTVFSLPWSFEW